MLGGYVVYTWQLWICRLYVAIMDTLSIHGNLGHMVYVQSARIYNVYNNVYMFVYTTLNSRQTEQPYRYQDIFGYITPQWTWIHSITVIKIG